jgi:hypothetical protein
MLVGVEQHRALACGDFNRDDLVLEVPGGDGGSGAALALAGELVLHLARDFVALGHVLGGDAHVHFLPGVVQDAEHVVDALGVAHAHAVACGGVEVGAPAHGLRPAAHGHVEPVANGLRRRDDGLQARAAQAVDVEGGRLDGAARVDGGHAAQVRVLGVGGDHVAHDHMAHGVGRQARALDGRFDGGGGELGVGNVFQRAAEGADGGAGGADNENVAVGHVKGSVEKWVKS